MNLVRSHWLKQKKRSIGRRTFRESWLNISLNCRLIRISSYQIETLNQITRWLCSLRCSRNTKMGVLGYVIIIIPEELERYGNWIGERLVDQCPSFFYFCNLIKMERKNKILSMGFQIVQLLEHKRHCKIYQVRNQKGEIFVLKAYPPNFEGPF